MKGKKNKRKGFTLIEVLVVIAIIAVLASVAAPNALKAIERSRISGVESDYNVIKSAVLGYYSDTGYWPANQGSNVDPGLVKAPTTTPAGWNGPYMEKWKGTNPWRGSYVYHINLTVALAGGEVGTNYKYITLTNIPKSAVTKIEQDLDASTDTITTGSTSGTVRFTANSSTIYLIISDQ